MEKPTYNLFLPFDYSIAVGGRHASLARIFYLMGLAFLGVYYPKVGPYAICDWLGFLAVIAGFGGFLLRFRFPVLNRYVVIAGSFLLFGAIATIPNMNDLTRSLISVILMSFTLILWMSLPSMLFYSWKHLHMAFAAIGFSAIVTSMYAIGQKILGFPYIGDYTFWGRATGLTRHPNELGTFCAMALPYLLCLTTVEKTVLGRVVGGAGALLTLLAILFSGSMTGTLALTAGVFGYYVLTTRRGRFKTAILIILSAITMVGFIASFNGESGQIASQRIGSFVHSGEGKYTWEMRLAGYYNAWEYIKTNPLQGKGYHSQVETTGVTTLVHNTFLGAWYDGGIFTLLAVLSLLFGATVVLTRTWRQLTRENDMRHKPYVAATVGAFLAFFISIQASPVLYQRTAWFPVALVFAVYLIARRAKTMVALKKEAW